jgi:hypothetical protein
MPGTAAGCTGGDQGGPSDGDPSGGARPDGGAVTGSGRESGPAAGPGRAFTGRAAGLAVTAVLALVLAFDLTYLARGTYRAPTGDPARYAEGGMLLLATAYQRLPWTRPWLSDLAPHVAGVSVTPEQLTRRLAEQGPVNPALLAAGIAVFGLDPDGPDRAMHTVQVVLHLASAFLVWVVARNLAGPGIGLTALVLFALYAPGTYMTSQLLSENPSLPLVLLAAYAGLRLPGGGGAGRGAGFGALLGLSLAALALTRPVYIGLAFLGLGAVAAWAFGAVLRRRGARAALLGAGAAAACFLAPYLAWQAHMVDVYHLDRFPVSPAGPREIGTIVQESYNVRDAGWEQAGIVQNLPRERFPQPTVTESILGDPLGSAALRVEKLYRLWRFPSDKYGNPLLLPRRVGEAYHVGLVILGVVGLWLLRRRWALIPVALPILYTTGIYTATFSDERRFAYPVMGLVIVLAAVALRWAWREAPGALAALRDRRRAAWAAAWMGVVLVAGLGVFRPSAFALPGPVGPRGQYLAFLAVLAVALAAACAVAGRRLAAGDRRAGAGAALLLVGLLLVPPVVHLARFHDWSTWRLCLDRPGPMAVQRIELPPDLGWDRVSAATLQVDVVDPDGRADGLVALADGRPLKGLLRGMGGSLWWLRLAAETQAPLVRGVDWDRLNAVPGMHQWLVWRLDPAAFAGRRAVTFAVGLAPNATAADAVTLFGDEPAPDGTDPGPRVWVIPELVEVPLAAPPIGRAAWKRHELYGDLRIHGGTRLVGHSESRYVPDAARPAFRTDDLSDAPLRQTGTYRIRLQLLTRDGRELVL